MPNIYGGCLPKAYGTSMVVKLRKQFKALEQAFSFGNESNTTALTKPKPSGHVLSCLAMFNDILWRSLCMKESRKKREINNCRLC